MKDKRTSEIIKMLELIRAQDDLNHLYNSKIVDWDNYRPDKSIRSQHNELVLKIAKLREGLKL